MNPMEIVLISLAALLASLLTFFSGFGLGTILLPVFALFFPVDIAIALTGLVHFANNLFKIVLVGRHAQKSVLFRFGIPAIAASFAGAWLLLRISGMPVVAEYSLAGKTITMTPVKLIIGSLLLIFSVLELTPGFKKVQFGKNKLIYGGLLSGFFGGLTGIQGAIRSAFLIKAGLAKEAYIATGVVIACFIDFTRLSVYASRYSTSGLSDNMTLLVAATLSAMLGAVAGNFLLKKITLSFIQIVVAVMLILISLAMIAGIV
jgi:uncharacterized protein